MGAGARPREVREQLDYDAAEEKDEAERARVLMNLEQAVAFDTIDSAVRNKTGGCYFLNAPGGTGKTFTANAIIRAAHGRSEVVLAMATSGIAALLLNKGATAHSTLKIPVSGLDAKATLNVSLQSGRADDLGRGDADDLGRGDDVPPPRARGDRPVLP